MSWAGWLCRDLGSLVKHNKIKSTLQLHDNRASPVSWDPSIGSCNTGIKITSAELASPENWAGLGHVISPYCELYCHAVCT